MAKIFGVLNKRITKEKVSELLKKMYLSFDFGSANYKVCENFGGGHIKIPSMNKKGICHNNEYVVCFSGKLVNIPDEKINNEEKYILEEYSKNGVNFFESLNGVFAFSIYDRKNDSLLLVNDRMGMKPLYYYYDNKKIVFGSEIKAIIEDTTIKRDIDWDFWKDYFAYGYSLGEKTPILQIKALPAGCYLEYKRGNVVLNKYWDYHKVKLNEKRTESETIREGVHVIKNVMERNASGLTRCIVSLTGGYDSRCIAASLKKYTNVQFKTITGARFYSNELDIIYAKGISALLNVENVSVDINKDIYKKYFKEHIWILDGMGSQHIWVMPIIDSMDSHSINFDGMAGDALIKAGYILKPELDSDNDLSNDLKVKSYDDHKLSEIMHNKMIAVSNIDGKSIYKFFYPETRKEILPDKNSLLQSLGQITIKDNKVKIFQLNNRTRNSISLAPNNMLMRKTFSYFPFCDNEFVEFALSIPVDMKLRNNIYVKILKASFPEIMQIPSTNDPKDFKEKLKKFLVEKKLDSLRYLLGDINKYLKKTKKIAAHNTHNPRDVDFLIEMAKDLNMPSFIDKDTLITEIDNHVKNGLDPNHFLEPIMQFCVWYDLFMRK